MLQPVTYRSSAHVFIKFVQSFSIKPSLQTYCTVCNRETNANSLHFKLSYHTIVLMICNKQVLPPCSTANSYSSYLCYIHQGHQQVVLCTSDGGGNLVPTTPVLYTMEQQQDLMMGPAAQVTLSACLKTPATTTWLTV